MIATSEQAMAFLDQSFVYVQAKDVKEYIRELEAQVVQLALYVTKRNDTNAK